ncbi:MAG: hypothetical protein E7621_00570 [Ruminococcaceae bacterium]|nr:hypothetical protein [Oscillospiraceae bacterium]
MKTKRILSTILAIVFVLSTFTFSAVTANAESVVVYLDNENGNDANSGLSRDDALKTFAKAFSKINAGDTIHVIGNNVLPSGNTPDFGGEITIKGDGAELSSIETSNNGEYGLSTILKNDIRFEDISVNHDELWGYISANGYKLTFGPGSKNEAVIHVGPTETTLDSDQYFVLDGGVVNNAYMGGGYVTNDVSIAGDLTVEVLSGTLESLRLAQDYYGSGYGPIYVGGNINVRIGADGVINKMVNSGAYLQPKGALVFIVEEGGQMCDIDIANFDKKEYYWVNVASGLENGAVEFSNKAGYISLDCDAGYIAEIEYADGTLDYAQSGAYKLPANEEVTVSFRNDIALADSVNIILEAESGSSDWTVEVSEADQFEISAVITNSNGTTDDTVGYYEKYTYDVTLTTKDGFVLPKAYEFKINGLSAYSKDNVGGYRITDHIQNGNTITFTYVADYTEPSADMKKISLVGFADEFDEEVYLVNNVPTTVYLNEGEQYTVPSTPVFAKLGYTYTKYEDQNGAEYEFGAIIAADEISAEGITLVPVWEEEVIYTVNFEPTKNGDPSQIKGSHDDIDILANGFVTIPENNYSYIGYKFTHWFDDNDNEYYPGEIYDVEELFEDGVYNICLYAAWEENALSGEFFYVDKETGADYNDGSKENPFKTIRTALEVLGAGQDATIIVLDEADIKGDLGMANDEQLGNITITGDDEESVLNITGYMLLGSDTVIENIKLNVSSGAYLVTNGHKAVIGPNLENVEGSALLDIIDGDGYGKTVDFVDTTINNNVKIGSYYLGGRNLMDSAQGIAGDVMLTIKGAEINNIDLSPYGDVQATFGGHIIVNVYNSEIGTLKSSLAHYAADSNLATMIFFNDGSMPDVDANLIANLKERNRKVFIIDSGIGGTTGVTSPINYKGKVSVTADGNFEIYNPAEDAMELYTGSQDVAIYNINTGINRVRFGEPIKKQDVVIEGDIGTPVGGAPAATVSVTPATENVKIMVESWNPDVEKSNGMFEYDTLYSANLVIVPDKGYFFDDFYLAPYVEINGISVDAKLGNDGKIRFVYAFTEKTDEAPVLANPITFTKGEGATGTAPYGEEGISVEILGTITLPSASTMAKTGYKFAGWREYINGNSGKLYGALTSYTVPKVDENAVIVFEAEWIKRTSWELPSIVILYDLSIYANDKGRNPVYRSDDAPIVVDNAFANLEHEISGTMKTKTTTFDYENDVTEIKSDNGVNPIKINNWSLDYSWANAGDYKYVTIVYYYKTETEAAKGGYGSLLVGNFKLENGSTSNWIGKNVISMNEVEANKWAAVTFDLSEVVSQSGIPATAIYRQFQFCPIGSLPCYRLPGDTVYLKSMTFSKYAPEVK